MVQIVMQHVQTKREIVEMLRARGMRPRKRFGQHFLVDGNSMRRLVDVAELDLTDRVLEVGAGTGGLTDLLVERADIVTCVEIDRILHDLLQARFGNRSNVRLILGDALAGKHKLNPQVAQFVEADGRAGCVKLVANLPYQVATPLVMNLLLGYPEVSRLVFTVQREVADRLTSAPNCKAYGPLSILVQLLSRIEAVATLPPDVFWPRPAVESTLIRIDVGSSPFSDREELGRFAHLVRSTFDHRRKTIRSALGYVLEDRQRDLVCASIDSSRRPESFSIEEWLSLYRTLAGRT